MIITSGRWRGHYAGCATAGCEATRCGNVTARRHALDEDAKVRQSTRRQTPVSRELVDDIVEVTP